MPAGIEEIYMITSWRDISLSLSLTVKDASTKYVKVYLIYKIELSR